MTKTKAPAKKPAPLPMSRRQTVAPTNVINLMNAIGGTRTAAKLGVSTTLLYKAKKEGAINQVVEVAAAHALEHLVDDSRGTQPGHFPASAPAPQPLGRAGDMLFLVSVAPDKAEMVQRMAIAMGAQIIAA